jgi:tetratricopeptide (TPR) repeat protein
LQPNDSGAWFNRGLALGQMGRLEEAIVSYDKALELQTDKYQSCWYNRSIALHQLGRLDEAIASYERVLELQPDFSTAGTIKPAVMRCRVMSSWRSRIWSKLLISVLCNVDEMARSDSEFDRIRPEQQFQQY